MLLIIKFKSYNEYDEQCALVQKLLVDSKDFEKSIIETEIHE